MQHAVVIADPTKAGPPDGIRLARPGNTDREWKAVSIVVNNGIWYAKCNLRLILPAQQTRGGNRAVLIVACRWTGNDPRCFMNAKVFKYIMVLSQILVMSGLLAAAEKGTVDSLARDLKSSKSNVRAHAAADLARLGPEAAEAVPALIAALQDESAAVRHEALNAIDRIGPAARAAAPALIDALKTKEAREPRFQTEIMNALGSLGHDSSDAVPVLSDYLAAEDERVSVGAAFALARILRADDDAMKSLVPVLVKGLQSKHRQIQYQAVRGLSVVGQSAVPALAELVGNHDQDPHSAVAAASALRMLGPGASPALPALREAMKSQLDEVVTNAADVVGMIGPGAKDLVPDLQKLLNSDHPLLRAHAAHSLGALGPSAAPAVPDLRKALGDKDVGVRREAIQALGQIGPQAGTAVSDLIGILKDKDQSLVLAAAHALARLGPDAIPALVALMKDRQLGRWAIVIVSEAGEAAAPAVDALRAALSEADDDLAREIILALAKIGPKAKAAAPDLLKIAEDQDNKLRTQAVFAVGNIRLPDAIPVLEQILRDSGSNKESESRKELGSKRVPGLKKEPDAKADPNLPLVAAGALVLIESPTRPEHLQLALPQLIAALNDKSDVIRREAIAALRQIGPRAASAVPALLQCLKDPNPAVSIDSLWALTAIAPATSAPALVPTMLPLLSSPIPQMRFTACYAVGSLGPAAKDAVPLLEKNLGEPDQFLQMASAWALVRIQPDKSEVVEECIDSLLRGLKMPDPRVQSEAAATLGMLGPRAQRSVPALTEARQDPDEGVRKAAGEALDAIGAQTKDQADSAPQQKRRVQSAR